MRFPILAVLLCIAGCAAPPVPASAPGGGVDLSLLPPPPAGARALNAGTGFFVRHDGTLLTAAHVAQGCRRIDVGSDTVAVTPADAVLIDADADLAVLRAPGAAVAATLRPAERTSPRDNLEAFGYPREGGLLSATRSRPVLMNAFVRPDHSADLRDVLWLQDNNIALGWSGGPVLDRSGGVVGVTLAVVSDPAQTTKVLDQEERDVAKATGGRWIADVLARAGVEPDPAPGDMRSARRAVVRVFCWR